MGKNLQDELHSAWAEFYFIRNDIETKLNEIINNDEFADDDKFYSHIEFHQNEIMVIIAPGLSSSTISKINELLGNVGNVRANNKKKQSIIIEYHYPVKIDPNQSTFDDYK